MHIALIEATRLPQHFLIGWVLVVQSLAAMGIAVRFVDMPLHELGDLDTAAGELRIRSTAGPSAQMWLMQEAWTALTTGPHACSGELQPRLHLVPPQRSAEPRLN